MTAPTETAVPPHPCKWSQTVLDAISRVLEDEYVGKPAGPIRLLDPFAGVGLDRLVALCPIAEWDGLEIEAEWAAASERTTCGDVRNMPWQGPTFNGLVTSCTYANRMADSHDAKDDSARITYRHKLGRMPTEGSSSVMQWSNEYRRFHEQAWSECLDRLVSGALIVVNVSNHIRNGEEQPVVEFHMNAWLRLGAKIIEVVRVPTPRMGFGANGQARTDSEKLLVLRAPNKAGML